MTTTFPSERIERSILFLRGHKILLDVHLAALYGVTTKWLNEQVKRNRSRFPADFMFQLTTEETASLRSQSATSNRGRGGRRYRPYAFTEQGVAICLGAQQRTCDTGEYRDYAHVCSAAADAGSNAQLARKLADLEKKYEAQFKVVFDAIRQLMAAPEPKKRKIGFLVEEKAAAYGRR